jgi:hypothetical protein
MVKAYEDSGMRAVVALRIFDGEYDDIFPDPATAPPGLIDRLQRISPLRPQPLAKTVEIVEDCIGRWNGHAGRIRAFLKLTMASSGLPASRREYSRSTCRRRGTDCAAHRAWVW